MEQEYLNAVIHLMPV